MSEIAQTKVLPQVDTNPLLRPWETPHHTPPFDEIKPEHFLPAFEQAFTDHAAEITAITHDPAVPDFDNTITALERSGKLLNKVSAVFYDLVSAHSNPEILEIDKEVSLRMARHWNPIMMNGVLFGRIALLHDNRTSLKLTPEQQRLLERTYTRFHRAGAGLSEDGKKQMAEINERLAQLGTTFSHHLLADEQEWVLELGEADFAGLSDTFIAAAKAAAEERGMAGKAIVTLSRSSVEPFLQSSGRRDLREKVYKAFIARGDNGNANDNNAVIGEILELREASAKLLGYPTFAAYRLEDSMAKTPEAVRSLLERVWRPARARALADRDEMQALIAEEGNNFKLAAWDWRYYAEKLRQKTCDFDEAAIKPYLNLDSLIEASFYTAQRLFGVGAHHGQDVALGTRAVEAEQQIGRGQIKEVQGVRLQDLAVVQQPPQLLRRRCELPGANDDVQRLGRRQMVADRTNAAEPLDDDRNLPVHAAADEAFEAAELDDVKARIVDLAGLVQANGDFAVAFDARDRIDHDLARSRTGLKTVHNAPLHWRGRSLRCVIRILLTGREALALGRSADPSAPPRSCPPRADSPAGNNQS